MATAHFHGDKDGKTSPVSGERTTRLMGEGKIDWPSVLQGLLDVGYDGCISTEYEKIHRDYLPEPETGMAHELAYLKRFYSAHRQRESGRFGQARSSPPPERPGGER